MDKQIQNKAALTVLLADNTTKDVVAAYEAHKQDKIRTFGTVQDHRFKETHQALNLSAFNIGIRQKITDQEFDFIKKFLVDNFGDFSNEEIIIAFDKYAAGKLDFDKPAFQSMDNKFIGDVLNSYKRFRRELISEQSKKEHEEKMKALQREPTEEEKKQIRKEFLETCFVNPYNRLLATGVLAMDEVNRAYFCKQFYIGLAFIISEGDKDKYNGLAERQLREEQAIQNPLKVGELNLLIKAAKEKPLIALNAEEKSLRGKIKQVSSALFFRDWLTDQAKKKTKIEELLKYL